MWVEGEGRAPVIGLLTMIITMLYLVFHGQAFEMLSRQWLLDCWPPTGFHVAFSMTVPLGQRVSPSATF